MAHVTDREKLETDCRMTVEWNFGQLCDIVRDAAKRGVIPHEFAEAYISDIRKYGNEAIRAIKGHLQGYNVIVNHRDKQVNVKRVTARAERVFAFGREEKG